MATPLGGAFFGRHPQPVRTQDSISVEPADLKVDDSKRLSFSAFAEVFRGTLRGEDVLVKRASKIWRKTQGRLSTDEFLARTVALFHQEFDLVRSLNHPNIVQTFGLCWPESLDVALVLECLPTCLQIRLPRVPYLTFSQAVDIQLDVTKATDYLHRRQLVHRDIAVSNVFIGLGSTGNRLLAKLSDFSNVGALKKVLGRGGIPNASADGNGSVEAESSLDVHDLGALVCCIALRVDSIDLGDKDYLLGLFNAPQLQEFRPLLSIISDCMARETWKRPTIGALIARLQDMRSSEEYRKSDLQTKKPPAVIGIPSVGAQVPVKAAFGEQPKQVPLPTQAARPSISSAQASINFTVGLLAVQCPICTDDVDKTQVWTMMGCQHDVCYTCLRQHCKTVIQNLSVLKLVCPVCGQPELEDILSNTAQKYFSEMDELVWSHLP